MNTFYAMALAANQAHSTHLSKTATVEDYERGEDISVLREKFYEGVRAEDSTRLLVWAGSGVGLMYEIKPAKVCALRTHYETAHADHICFASQEIVQELHEECLSHIKRTARLLSVT